MTLHHARLLVTGLTAVDGEAYAVAERALLGGAHVTVTAPPDAFEHCRALVAALPRGAHAVRADARRPEGRAALLAHLRCAYGRLDGAFCGEGDAATRSALEADLAPLLAEGAAVVAAGDAGHHERDAAAWIGDWERQAMLPWRFRDPGPRVTAALVTLGSRLAPRRPRDPRGSAQRPLSSV